MSPEAERPRGATPVLRADYARRAAERQAAFVLPLLREGMSLLDLGCGPGSITIGLATRIAPGRVTGVDYDAAHLEQARAAADNARAANLTLQEADVRELPFADATFDVVFENDLLIHVAEDAPRVLSEAHRVLKPGGLMAARDTAADAALWGGSRDGLDEFDRLFFRWHARRGSDLMLGRRLPGLLIDAGFGDLAISVSADTKATPAEVAAQSEMMLGLLNGPLGQMASELGWADRPQIERLRSAIERWGRDAAAYFANVHLEVIGHRHA